MSSWCSQTHTVPTKQRRSVGLEEMRTRVAVDDCVVIALVDKRKVRTFITYSVVAVWTNLCSRLQLNHHRNASTELYNHGFGGANSGYTGHYILICGYSEEQHSFVVQDPASSRPALMVPEASLDYARKTFGTDEDLLIISMRRALAEGVEQAVLLAKGSR